VGNDVNILSSELTNSSQMVDFVTGSDLNLYYTAHANFNVGKIVTVLGTTNNTASAFALERGVQPRSLTSDGYYLVIAGDSNDSKLTTIIGKCKIYFWDKAKSTADVIWTIPDAYLIGCRFVNGRVLVIGYSGIWECNLHTPPKLVQPLLPAQLPASVAQIDVQGSYLVWVVPTIQGAVYMYGSLIGKPILFSPYTSSGSTDLGNALVALASKVITSTTATGGSSGPSVYLHNTGSTRANSSVKNATEHLGRPYALSYIKATLFSPFSSGQALALSAFDSASRTIMDVNTKSYSATNPHKDLIFLPLPVAGSITAFEDLALTINPQGGAVVERVTVYGVPQDEATQLL
jgi:hypothetical protein